MDHLQSMRVFVKVVDLRGFTRAATAFGISTAVATRYVADLEARLGTRLLNRTTRSLSLTESGEAYLDRARNIVDGIETIERMVTASNHEPAGKLRIVAPVVFAWRNLGPVLQTYSRRYPGVALDLRLADHQVDLVEEGFDVGIMPARDMRSASIVSRRLTNSCMMVCATPKYLATHGTPTHPEHLAGHACLSLPSASWADENLFAGPEGAIRIRPTKVIVANNVEMLRQLALLDMGIAVLPRYLVNDDLKEGLLVPLLGSYRLPEVEFSIVYPSRRHLPVKVRTFVDHLVEHFAQESRTLPAVFHLDDQQIAEPVV